MIDDFPRTLSLQELWDWKAAWYGKRRPSTTSECFDYEDCDQQINASNSTMDWETHKRWLPALNRSSAVTLLEYKIIKYEESYASNPYPLHPT